MKMVPFSNIENTTQYMLTNPNNVFKHNLTDKWLNIKITNCINDVLFDDLAIIKYKDDWSSGMYSNTLWRYHLLSKNSNVNIFIITDYNDKINCMSIDYEISGKRIEIKSDDRVASYSMTMTVN